MARKSFFCTKNYPMPYPPVTGSRNKGSSGGTKVKTAKATATKTKNKIPRPFLQRGRPFFRRYHSARYAMAAETKKRVMFTRAEVLPKAPFKV